MAMFIHGVGASEAIDSSGEVVSIAGMDISSLTRDGNFNWDHKKDLPEQTVGKVLKAKKIFSEEDCEDEHQLYFWHKCQVPYVYVMGELFDDYCESAKHVAGMFLYDADRKGKQEFNVVSFSIEGATIEKKGNVIARSIARKVTITNLPCNKTAAAEMVQAGQKDDLHDLFKTENTGILVLRVEPPKRLADDMKKHAEALGIPMNKAEGPKTTKAGVAIGATSSGKPVMSHGKIHEYHDFSHQDHQDAADLHQQAATQAHQDKNVALVDHHLQKKKMHLQAAETAKKKSARFNAGLETRQKKIAAAGSKLQKTLTAGSGNTAPGQLTGGAALAKESVEKKVHKAEINKPLFNKVPGNKTTPGLKAGMGMSPMGMKVREGNTDRAKEMAQKKLKKDEAPPPPTIGDTATAGGTTTINSQIGSPFGKAEQAIAEAHPNDLRGKSHMVRGQAMRYVRSTAAAHHFAHPDGKRMVQVKRTALQKSELLERAEQEYALWDKRELFVTFMKERMPNLTKGEIVAIGQTLALKKALEAEASLAKMAGLEPLEKVLKFGSEEDQRKVAEAMAERAKNPPKKAEPKKKAPEVTHPIDGEVSHTSGYGAAHETVHLKSGHELHGVKKGRFKAGDKVHVKPYIMNTFLVEHGHQLKKK